jgi:hypothetical protein
VSLSVKWLTTQQYYSSTIPQFFALQVLLTVTALTAAVMVHPISAFPFRSAYVAFWPRIPGRFYIRQTDPITIAKDGVTSGPVPAGPISVAAAAPPRAMAPKSPDFPASTTRLG